jgi:hypothetical protein
MKQHKWFGNNKVFKKNTRGQQTDVLVEDFLFEKRFMATVKDTEKGDLCALALKLVREMKLRFFD